LAAGLVALAFSQAATAGTAWQRWAIARADVSIELPGNWVEWRTQGGTIFTAGRPEHGVQPGVAVALYPGYANLRQLARRWIPFARHDFLAKNPNAKVSTARRLRLPIGPAIVITAVTVDEDKGIPVVVACYMMLHSGTGYEFVFESSKSAAAQFGSIVTRAANSIRFSE
jgi:hypothetical protein